MSCAMKALAWMLIVAPAIAHAESTINARLQDSPTAASGATSGTFL